MALFFGIIMAVGLLYLLGMIFGGVTEVFDFDLDGALEGAGLGWLFGIGGAADALDGVDDLGSVVDAMDAADAADATSASTDVKGAGCLTMTIAAFMAVFGAIGVAGTYSERSLWLILLVGVLVSYAVARVVTEVMKYVLRQQGNEAFSTQDLIGKTAQATINAAPGKTGEVMVEMGRLLKYPVHEVNGEALQRGDTVLIVGLEGRYLKVTKQQKQVQGEE
jgi:membrane protein implicated in regulation of membrane protease activity